MLHAFLLFYAEITKSYQSTNLYTYCETKCLASHLLAEAYNWSSIWMSSCL